MGLTAWLFLGFVVATAAAVLLMLRRAVTARSTVVAGAGLAMWLIYVGVLSRAGVVMDPGLRPPGIVYVVGPAMLFVLFGAARSRTAGVVARALPLPLLIGIQAYRIGAELFLHQLWREGLAPRMLTFAGANIDLWIGASAPLVAWVVTRGRGAERMAAAWSVLGLVSLANVIARSALTAPGPLHLLDAEVANRVIGTFPYTLIAGFLAPLAVTLHVLALRALAARLTLPSATSPCAKESRA